MHLLYLTPRKHNRHKVETSPACIKKEDACTSYSNNKKTVTSYFSRIHFTLCSTHIFVKPFEI